ncbi:MAG: WbqC family protein [Flavobacteriales bacterium]|nr:WbqC family protein [Flavobacteriales bacterium]
MESNNQYLLLISYLAPIGYYAILLQNSNCEIEQYEHFVKQSIRNRCDIYGANGKLTLSIPKQRKASSKTLIKDIKIAYNHPWQKEHWKSICSAYRSSAYFEFYEDLFVPFYEKNETFLLDFNLKLQEVVFKCLQIKDSSTLTKSYQKKILKNDFRNSIFEIKNTLKYHQVFEDKCGFIPNLSIIDLLFNLGPESSQYLLNIKM